MAVRVRVRVHAKTATFRVRVRVRVRVLRVRVLKVFKKAGVLAVGPDRGQTTCLDPGST